MCLIALAWRIHPRYRLALIANRDEFHARPTASADFDPDTADVYGGRDLQAGGSWLQVSARGRLAAVTNVRVGRTPEQAPRSRGALVSNFARENTGAERYVATLQVDASKYGRFNLLVHDGEALVFASNHPHFQTQAVAPGLHAMSNGAFDAPWPKSGRALDALSEWLDSPEASDFDGDAAQVAPLFEALANTTPAPDAALPDTGISLELERMLSPAFLRGERYGTRCSSVVLVDEAAIFFAELRYGPDAQPLGQSSVRLPSA
ncbi:MAG: NRDE family protein [Luteimonas sp.]